MDMEFSGPIWYWRGPSPFYFVSVPEEESQDIAELKTALTYGWGVIPVRAVIGETEFETSLFPKDGLYALPLKVAVRKSEGLAEGDVINVRMSTGEPN